MKFEEYPKWIRKEGKEPVLVKNEAEEQDVLAEWHEDDVQQCIDGIDQPKKRTRKKKAE